MGGSVGVCLSACLAFFWEKASESERKREAEMRCFPRLESRPGSMAPPNLPIPMLPLRTINLPVYLLLNKVRPPTSLTHPSPPSTSDKDVPLFPIRPPNAPPSRTNNPSEEAQLVPSPASKGGRCLSPPRPLIPILLCILLPNLSICRPRRQSPRPRLSPVSCNGPSP